MSAIMEKTLHRLKTPYVQPIMCIVNAKRLQHAHCHCSNMPCIVDIAIVGTHATN